MKCIRNKNEHISAFIIMLGSFLMSYSVYAQEDTTTFQEVTIKGKHFKIDESTSFDADDIKALAPNDLGSLLQYMNGLTIKNYGGIGGMKTLSHRGMGGEHTQLIIDNKPVNNPQTGQSNLSTIPLNNVEKVVLSHQNSNNLVPVSGLVKGSSVQLQTFEQQFGKPGVALRSSFTLGSFGHKKGYVGVKKSSKKTFISLTGGYRSYDGDYPYQLKLGSNTQKVNRRNNALKDYQFNIGGGLKWSKNDNYHRLKFSAGINAIDQELPGAVILYNNMAKESLKTQNISSGINYSLFKNNFALKAFAQYEQRFLNYTDPSYLNADGFIDNEYTTESLYSGFHLRYKWKGFTFHAGNDVGLDQLASSRNLGQPSRVSNTTMLKSRYNTKYFNIRGSVFSQVYLDENTLQSHRNTYHKIHPQLSIYSSDKLLKNFQVYAWYKPSSRAPSFNELYYSQVGNNQLKPEESSQINLGSIYVKTIKAYEIKVQANLFQNKVKDKIIALPTQNLFVWSTQNVGKVDIKGADLNLTLGKRWKKHWKINLQAGMSYQKVIDISDRTSPTYEHQIAYTPEITGNLLTSVFYKNTGIHLSMLYIGERFSLNENIDNNRLDPYAVFDLTLQHSIKIKKKNQINVHLGVKNLMDNSYNFIKYFVMPGRNYFLKLSYEFN